MLRLDCLHQMMTVLALTRQPWTSELSPCLGFLVSKGRLTGLLQALNELMIVKLLGQHQAYMQILLNQCESYSHRGTRLIDSKGEMTT